MKTSRSTVMAYATFSAIAIFIISANTFAEDRESREESLKPQGQTANQPETISSPFNQHLRVRCDRGESLSRAIRRAREHQTVRFSGTCYESLVINKDHLTLLGEKGGTIDGSQLPSLCVPALVHLAVGAVSHHLDQVEDPGRVLEGGQVDVVQGAGAPARQHGHRDRTLGLRLVENHRRHELSGNARLGE